MKPKQDIGTYYKKKLDGTERIPDAVVWNRISASLDKKEKRKRRFFIIIFGTIGIILMGIFGSRYFSESTSEENKTETSSEIKNNSGIANEIPQSVEITSEEISIETVALEKVKFSQNGETGPSEKNNTKILDSFTTSNTTYYYYRSSDERRVVTTDRLVIDSLINTRNLDSANALKKKYKDQ